jgi:hypothetical protein
MDSKSDQNNSESSPEQADQRSEDGLLGRRDYLRLGAAAVGIVGAGAGSTLASAAGSAERNGIQFGNVVNAVDDLGVSEGDRVDGVLEDVAAKGDTLVQFPPGVYLVGSDVVVDADNFGVESTTQNRADVVFRAVKGRDPTMFQAGSDPEGFYVGYVSLDRRDEWESSMSLLRGNFAGKMYVKNVEMTGWAPESRDSIAKFNVRAGGEALIDGVKQKGPITYGSYPDGQTIAFFNGSGTDGSVTYRNLELHGSSESGIYAGKAYGPVRVEDSYFKNCAHSAVRVTGENSWIKNTTIVMDIDDIHPKSRVTRDDGDVPKLNRGIWAQSARFERTGPLIEDCEIVVENTGNGIAGILNSGDTGGVRVRNTRMEVNDDDVFPVLVQGERSDRAGRPYEAEFDGLSMTGTCNGRPAITIRDRDGSSIANSCIQMPNTDGIEFDGTSNGTIADTNVNVGGRATIFDGADVETTNLTSNDSCPVPNPDTWNGSDSTDDSTSDGTDGSTSDGTDGTTTDGTGTSGNRIVVAQVKEGAVVRYDITASDSLDSGTYATEDTSGDSVSGRVGRLRGVDDYYIDGYVTDFEGENSGYANVYFADEGVELDVDNYVLNNPEDLREADPAVLGQNVITVESDDEHASGFEFEASGDVVPGATGDGATVSDGTVSGSTVNLSAFHFTGSVSNIAVTDPQNVTVTVNGSTVSSDNLLTIGDSTDGGSTDGGSTDGGSTDGGSTDGGSTDGGSTDGGSTDDGSTDGGELPNTISIVGTGTVTNYDFTVSGDIAAASGSENDVADNISASSAEGAIESGTHAYNFSGDLTDLSTTGSVEVYLNGELVEDAASSTDQNLVVFDGSVDEEISSYRFAVTGEVTPSPEHSTAPSAEWDVIESKVGDGTAVGIVHEGKDAYWFTGDIERLELRGSAVTAFHSIG